MLPAESRKILFSQSRKVNLTVNGEIVQADAWETIASVLLRIGIKTFRHTHKLSQPRSLF